MLTTLDEATGATVAGAAGPGAEPGAGAVRWRSNGTWNVGWAMAISASCGRRATRLQSDNCKRMPSAVATVRGRDPSVFNTAMLPLVTVGDGQRRTLARPVTCSRYPVSA